ncbi:MAG: ABC transporter ATP-binding protein [Clostridia bacterium]|nr:ABC transporter ATP-binding protein [Clostridia bacterium]
MLESKQLTKRFGKKTALDSVTLTLEAGHVYAMLGPNGSGKTTWMKLAASLLKPDGGEILFRGRRVGIESRRHVAYMSTEPFFYRWMTARDVGLFFRRFYRDFDPALYAGLLERFELEEGMHTSEMSSGMMAKLKVAATLARNADVWMLDEPFNGIDLIARDDIADAILERLTPEKLILLSSHLVEELAACCDRAVFMRDSRLLAVTDMRAVDRSMAEIYREVYHVRRSEA